MITIYKPGVVPVRGLRTSLQGAQLGDGFFQSIDNLRWDTGVLKVRDGIATFASSAPFTTCLGAAHLQLGGAWYFFVAGVVGSETAIYVVNPTTGDFDEITAAEAQPVPTYGGSGTTSSSVDAGGTRLSSITQPVYFNVVTVPKRVLSGQVFPAKDILVITNYADYARIWEPAFVITTPSKLTMVAHQDIVLPAGYQNFSQLSSFSAFFPVAATSRPSYDIPSSTWKFADSSVAPYNSGSDTCIDLVAANPTSSASTRIDFANSVSFLGEQINFIVYPSGTNAASAVSDWVTNSKIEVSEDSSTWHAIYDPSSSEAALTIAPIQSTVSGTITMVTFSLKSVPIAERDLKYVKFTRVASASTNYKLTILAIAAAGLGAGFYGGTTFQAVYADRSTRAESGVLTSVDKGGELLKNIGGPSVTGSSSTPGAKIPVRSDVLYDYRLLITNPGTSRYIYGGLEGTANAVDVYFYDPAEAPDQSRYWATVDAYDATTLGSDHVWGMADPFFRLGAVQPVATVKTEEKSRALADSSYTDRDLRDPGTPPPSAFNIGLPKCGAFWTANQRSFAGNVQDSGGNAMPHDLYFSSLGFPFRFQSLQDGETSGSRLMFDGETIQAGAMTAAAANAASVVYVLTDQSFNALGTAGGFVGSGYDASSLAVRVRINAHGTREPRSLAERAGAIFYLDTEGQIVRFQNGNATAISRNAVEDRSKSIPGARRGAAVAAFWKDRYCLAYTPAGGTKNTRILAWNDVIGEWEFDDTLPSSVVAQMLVRTYDGGVDGSGIRIMLVSDDGNVYAYEEGATEPGSSIGPTVTLTSREYQSPSMDLIRVGSLHAMIDAHEATLNVDRLYKPRDSRFRTTIDCSDSEAKPKAIKTDTRIPVEQTATAKPEEGWSAALSFSGELGAGKTLWRIEADVEGLTKGAAERQ